MHQPIHWRPPPSSSLRTICWSSASPGGDGGGLTLVMFIARGNVRDERGAQAVVSCSQRNNFGSAEEDAISADDADDACLITALLRKRSPRSSAETAFFSSS